MSIPVLTFGCTACDLQSWDTPAWGYRFYKIGKKTFRMRVTMGWCQSCCSFCAVEIKPDTSLERQLVDKVSQQQAILSEQLLRTPPSRRWWQLRATRSFEVIQAERNLTKAIDDLASLRELLPLMATRRSRHRCLSCASEDCWHLPKLPVEASFDYFHPAPITLGMSHPGCSGDFTVSSDGLCLSVVTVPRAYDLEGRALPEAAEQG